MMKVPGFKVQGSGFKVKGYSMTRELGHWPEFSENLNVDIQRPTPNNQRPGWGSFLGAGKAGFTLIELLVVITIISILAGLLFPAALKMLQSSARTKVGVQAVKILNAVKLYQNDYSRWPGQRIQGNDGDIFAADVLSDLTNNVRNVNYLELQERAISPTTGALVDKWGRDFVIIMDEDGDRELSFSVTEAGTGTMLTTTIVNEVAAVMSWGRDPGIAKKRICSWK